MCSIFTLITACAHISKELATEVHAGTIYIGAIPYVNQCCTLYPPPPHTISTSLTDHVLRELFNYSYYSTIFFWVVAMVTIPVV